MAETTNIGAAIESNDISMSYALEADWGVLPEVAFQAVRMDSESFSGTKSRTRPSEINADGQASASITTKNETSGALNFSASSGTHNVLLAASMGGEFGATINMSASTIAATATGFTDSGSGFVAAGLVVGQMIKVSGFAGSTINTIYRIDTIAAGEITTTPVPATTEVEGATVSIKGQMCRNGKVRNSFFIQKTLSDAMFLLYAGSFPINGTLDVGVGDYLKGSVSFMCKSQAKATTSQSTGDILPAPTGRVIDSINGIGTVYRNGVAVDAIVQKVGLKWDKTGARGQYGIGSADAKGIGSGLFTMSGTFSTFFKDFSLYDEFIGEIGGPIWFSALDNEGKGFVLTICNATIMNPKIVAGGPNQDVMADFELEANPGDTTLYGGKTFQLDYFA